jgi:hypothetical protein
LTTIDLDSLPEGATLLHGHCRQRYPADVLYDDHAPGKPRCPACDEPAAWAGWSEVRERVEDEFPALFEGGFSKLPDALWDHGPELGLAGADYALIGRIWRHQSRAGRAFPDHAQLAAALGVAHQGTYSKGVQRAVRRLVAAGCLEIVEQGRRGDGRAMAIEYDLRPLWRRLAEAVEARTGGHPRPPDRRTPTSAQVEQGGK